MAAAVASPANHLVQLPQRPEQLLPAAAGPGGYAFGLQTVTATNSEEQQQLRCAGRQLAAHCSSLGVDLTAMHRSARALAGAAGALESDLYAGIESGLAAAAALKAGPGAGRVILSSAVATATDLLHSWAA
jgi:hypothetical protein